MSVDIPSGLSADESKNFPHVCADETVCITSRKLSSAVFPTKEAYGKIHVFDIGVNMTKELPLATISDDDILEFLPQRPKDSHKGTFGTLKTLCGSYNMTGAGILAITGALRCGVGLVKAFGDDKLLDIFKVRLAEPIYKTFSKEAFISEKSSAILIGCGIGTEYENDLRDILINADSPIIIDADGINFLSKNIDIIEQIPTSLIITPHPKEMARLCGCSVSQIQENRFSNCKEFSEKYGCTVVLKGAGTIIFTPNQTPIINESGNSGLSKGGSGDVLAGMISAFVAQGVTPHYAAALGVYLHGLAADSLKKSFSEFSFLPSDIPKEVGKILAEKLL
jgi:NAD(P)H-hydrate epimerase